MELGNINIQARMEHYHVSGMSIALIKNSEISQTECFGVLEAETNRMVNKQSIFNACSISKFLTSMLVLKLSEMGVLDLDEDVNERLTTWKVPKNEFTQIHKVTLRTLLSHQSGIIDPEGSFPELNSDNHLPTMAEILDGNTFYCKEAIKVTNEPGSDFQYSDAGFCIIQQLIEDVCAKPFDAIMNELLFEPLHMKNSTFLRSIPKGTVGNFSSGHHKTGNVVEGKFPIYPYSAAAGLWTTPSDLAELVIELMRSLKGKGKLGISSNTSKEIVTSQGCKEWTGLGVFLDSSNEEVEITSLGWGIGFQNILVVNPYLETGIIIMTNTDLGVHQLKGIIGEIIQSAVR